MKIVSRQEMYTIDHGTIEDYKVPSLILMENAGISVAHYIKNHHSDKKKIVLFVGPGDNGGDGLVLARHLFFNEFNVCIFFVGDKQKQSVNNKKNFQICRKLKIPFYFIREHKKWNKFKERINNAEIIVDALFGIGLNAPLRGVVKDIVEFINSLQDKIKIAIDMPSGLIADKFLSEGIIFNAHITITFGAPKIAHIFSPAREYCGDLICNNIGFPSQLLEDKSIKLNLITKKLAYSSLPERRSSFHKNDYGHVAVLAGSVGKSGAAILCSDAAIKSGAGLVTTICPEPINNNIQSQLREIMTLPIDLKSVDNAYTGIKELIEKSDVILCGCGMGIEKSVKELLKKILSIENKTFVLDADALNIIAEDIMLIKNKKSQFVLTPHIGEFSRLINKPKDFVLKNLLELTREFAKQHNIFLVVKSSETIITDAEGDIYVCNIGNDGMATAGSGDVLAGILTGILAQNVKQNKSILSSLIAGVFLHASAGDIGSKIKGKFSLKANDLITYLPDAFNKLVNREQG